MTEPLKAPFPWFGGKRKVAAEVWAALGDVSNYVEPFFGSGAVLLGRHHDLGAGARRVETVNDLDGFVANFWRALASDPDGVARYADWPVNEADLISRHLWLVTEGRTRLLNRLEADPEYFDAQIAGWWVWGQCSWIGSGWCSGTGPWMADDDGNMAKRPDDTGKGVNRQLPHLGDAGQGMNRQLPHLGNAGRGVNRQLPHLSNAGKGVNRGTNTDGLTAYLRTLADRLRLTRVCCGDWSRVVTMGALSYGPTVGVFLDPPYLGDVRTADLYATDDHTIAHEVREWCLENGDDPRYRIVLAGYSAEHDHLIPDTWRRHRYAASAAYSTAASAERQDGNHTNRHGEVLWMSPHCIGAQRSLFDMGAA